MKGITSRYAILILLVLLAAIIASLIGCGRQDNQTGGKMLVAASIAPLADFSKQVGGDLVHVEVLVPPGASAHTYQLTPDQMNLISNASVLVLNGINLEYWADKAVDAADNSELIVIRTAEGLPTITSEDEHDHGGKNPHTWLNPVYAIRQVEVIRDAFIKADPSHKKEYTANAEAYIVKLKQLDSDIRQQIKTFSSKRFIAFHPAWVYFAQEYGLVQAAVIEESPGREPSPAEIRDIINTARRLKAKAIFAEPQFSPKAAQVVADEVGAKVLYLDPHGKPPSYNYIETMHGNLAEISKALK